MQNVKITKVFRKDGKVTYIHCGQGLNITSYRRVDINGERFFMLANYGAHKLYKPNKQTRCMEYVGSI